MEETCCEYKIAIGYCGTLDPLRGEPLYQNQQGKCPDCWKQEREQKTMDDAEAAVERGAEALDRAAKLERLTRPPSRSGYK